MSRRPRPSALLRAAHAGPTLAVTGVAAAIAWASGAPVTLTALAVLSGQLSVGWLNDLLDEDRDREVNRGEKPLVAGELTRHLLVMGIATATVCTAILSFLAFSAIGGMAHLTAVASAQSYNVWLKSTVLSWLPYAISFGLLPTAVLLGAETSQPLQLAPAGALLGVAAHFANVVPDIERDRCTGVRGLPQRWGAVASTWLAIALLITVALLLINDLHWIVLIVGCASLLGLPAARRMIFPGVVVLAIVDVLLLLDSLRT